MRSTPPNGSLRRLPLGAVRPRGWLQAQMRRDLGQGFAGCLDQLSPHVARDLFRERLDDSTQHAAWWDAESRGNWLWGYTMLAHLCDDPQHRERANALISALRASADSDGYIGIHTAPARYPAGGTENGELWAQSRALLVLLAHYELTGDRASLDAARRAADLTLRQYGAAHPHFGRHSTALDRTGLTHGLCYTDAVEQLHEITGDERYRQFARWLLHDFDAWEVPFPNDDMCAANLANPQRNLQGHAVHTVEHLRALAFGGAGSGRIGEALHKLDSSMTPSGAVIGDESLHGLPGPDAAYEYCTLTELLFSLVRLAQRFEDAELGDSVERLAFNAAQGARQPDGRSLAYLCSDTRLDATAERPDSYSRLTGRHGRFKLSPTHDDVACCCNPNATRLLPHYVGSMWFELDDRPGLAALLYGPSEVQWRVAGCAVTIRQHTAYPFEDDVRFEVEVSEPLEMTLRLRRPAWASAVAIDGVAGVELDGWVTIKRLWQGRTEFTVHFTVTARAESYPGSGIAVLRGPLQFVQPIRHHARRLASHALPGFMDEELVPGDIMDVAAAIPVLDASAPDLGFEVERDAACDLNNPWSGWPIRLVAGDLLLVPIGCAPLRRAMFFARR